MSSDEDVKIKPERCATPTVSEPDEKDAADIIYEPEDNRRRTNRRIANIYDAVAGKRIFPKRKTHERLTNHHRTGRISHQRGTLTEGQDSSRPSPSGMTKHSLRGMPYGPDEVLFRRKDAPQRYAEHDIYYSNERDLPHGGRTTLPESDLLKAVHGYSSRFYEHLHRGNRHRMIRRRRGNVDARSMDETALLAIGILLEESGRHVLGKRGDTVFTEGFEEDKGSRKTAKSSAPDAVGPLEGTLTKRQERKSKRRKMMKYESE